MNYQMNAVILFHSQSHTLSLVPSQEDYFKTNIHKYYYLFMFIVALLATIKRKK